MKKNSIFIVLISAWMGVSLACDFSALSPFTSSPAGDGNEPFSPSGTELVQSPAYATTENGIKATETPLPTEPTIPTETATLTPTEKSEDAIIFFQGDLVSSNSMKRAKKVVDLIEKLIEQHPGAKTIVASTGDNDQENNPTLKDYQEQFDKTYGIFVRQGIFMPVRGNHDIQSEGHGAAYTEYFGAFPYLASHSGPDNYNYSYDLGAWHIVALDQLNGDVNPAALEFLKSDLASYAGVKCQLVYWHVPTYSSGEAHGDALGLRPLNQAGYAAGVDIQVNGHDHDYERYHPINADGQRDPNGITTFIDGIGGQDSRSGSGPSIAQRASALYLDSFPGGDGDHAIGTIMFTLHSDSADYALYNANDGDVLDQGTVECH
jgi:hypothetical protein